MSLFRLLLAAGPEETTLRFRSLPPLWLLIMIVVPAVAGIVWWVYRRESPTVPRTARVFLAVLRFAAVFVILLLLFQPYAETSVKKLVKSHLVVLIDTSASMEFVDTYTSREKAEKTEAAAGIAGPASEESRIGLVKGTLGNRANRILDRLAEKFHLHVYTFDAETVLLASAGEAAGGDDGDRPLADRIADLRANGAWTMLGGSVTTILEEFRLRDEPLAGIVLLTDGRQNGGAVGPVEAARRAASSQPGIPLWVVGVGDPDLPRNIHVANLRAREVVLRGDDVTFEFTVTEKGFAGTPVTVRMEALDDRGNAIEDLDLKGADVVLAEEGEEQVVRVTHRFPRSGSFTVRLGIPVEKGEKIENDNFLVHHIRVVDKKIKVLYVEGYPRWEYRYLKDYITRDRDTMLANVILLDADPDVVQPFTDVPGWKPRQHFPRTKEELFDYDVVIFGDVDWRRLGDTVDQSKEMLEWVKQFVEDGGGFIMIAGEENSPRAYRNPPIADILPVILSREAEMKTAGDTATSFNLELTEEGEKNPIMQLADEPAVSKRLWEQDRFSAQFWYYPVERAKTTATVLAVHPGEFERNQYGKQVLIALMPFKKGTSLYIGVDELWRLRWTFGSRFHYRFYGEAIRLLATRRLLGGNKRFKIFTDRDTYFVGDPVEISAKVYDREYNPSNAEKQVVTIQAPNGQEQSIELGADGEEAGSYVQVVTVYQEGTYRIFAEPPDPGEERPERLFKVEYSSAEMKNPLIDLDTMTAMARESGGAWLPLFELPGLPDRIPPRSVYVNTEVRSEDLWDDTWILFLFTGILAAEWLVRKRYRLI